MGREKIILARLYADADERLVKCFSRKCAPFFVQFPQVRPKITDNDINRMIKDNLIEVDYSPCVQRGSGLEDDIASYFFNRGEVVYGLTEKGRQIAPKNVFIGAPCGSHELVPCT